MKKLEKTKIEKEPLLMVLILAVILVFFYQMIVSPQIEYLKSLSAQYKSQTKLLDERKHKVQSINFFKESNEKMQKELVSLNKKFLKKEDITSCLEELSSLAKSTGNILGSISPLEQKRDSEEGIIEYMIILKLKGKYVNITKFLGKLQSQERLSVIDTAELLVAQEGVPILEAHFKIKYFLIDELALLKKEKNEESENES